MSAQLRLNLRRPPDFSRESFVVSALNRPAVAALDEWRGWRGGVLVLVGPAGSGKTHLATSWAAQHGATVLHQGFGHADLAHLNGHIVLDDADQAEHGEALFHLLNMVARSGGAFLATAATPPAEWSADIPDLRSRLNALPTAELYEPDDAVLTALLQKFFQARNIKPSDDLLFYLARRIERSAPGAEAVVAQLDEAASALDRPVTRALARDVLDSPLIVGRRET